MIGLIPAKGHSRRLPGKNLRVLRGHPLLAYTIAACRESRAFDRWYVCTDDDRIEEIADRYGAAIVRRQPSGAHEPDIVWVRDVLTRLSYAHADDGEAFALVRATSPFRGPEAIRACVERFWDSGADSVRCVRPLPDDSFHPSKMWRLGEDGLLHSVLRGPTQVVQDVVTPEHSLPRHLLPRLWYQTASMEVAKSSCVLDDERPSISGTAIAPFEIGWPEGLDINSEDDWVQAERLAPMLPDVMR